MRYYSTIILLFVQILGFSQNLPRKKIVKIEQLPRVYDTSGAIVLKLKSTLINGKIRATGTGAISNIAWNKFDVTTTIGSFQKGIIRVNKGLLTKEKHSIEITIRPLNNPEYSNSIKIDLPFIQRIAISQKINKKYLPGESIPLDIYCYYSNGKALEYKNLSENEKRSFLLKIDHHLLAPEVLSMPYWDGAFKKSIEIKPVFAGQEIGNDLVMEYDIEKEIVVNRNGRSGRDGRSGRSSTQTASNGKDGTDGESGENGENGEHAPNIEIYLKRDTIDSEIFVHSLIKENGNGSGEEFYTKLEFLKLTVNCTGGDGGRGGNGGKGSAGQDGANSASSGQGGNGGHGGFGGHGGDGGRVEVFVSEQDKDLLEKLSVNNKGGISGANGSGGNSGRGGYAKDSKSILNLLFTGRSGYSGKDGEAGFSGRDGGIPHVITLK